MPSLNPGVLDSGDAVSLGSLGLKSAVALYMWSRSETLYLTLQVKQRWIKNTVLRDFQSLMITYCHIDLWVYSILDKKGISRNEWGPCWWKFVDQLSKCEATRIFLLTEATCHQLQTHDKQHIGGKCRTSCNNSSVGDHTFGIYNVTRCRTLSIKKGLFKFNSIYLSQANRS